MANGNNRSWQTWVMTALTAICAYLLSGWVNSSNSNDREVSHLSQQNKTEIAVIKSEMENLKNIVLEIRSDVKDIKNK